MEQSHLKGIFAMLAAVAFFAAMDAILKVFTSDYPPLQIGAMRGAASLPFVVASVAITGRWRDLRPVRWQLHLARGMLAIVMLGGFIYAVSILSLADAYSIFFVSPLLVTALAVPLLGERVGWRRWVAIAVGLCGVLWVIQPSGSNFTLPGALAALAAAFAYALTVIAARVLTRTEKTVAVVFWFLLLLTIFSTALALPGWVPIRTEHWPLIGLLGITGALGQHLITEAFRHAPASVIAPFEYTALLWAVAIDWLVWTTLPGSRMFVGGGLIIASGLYLLWRERQLHVALAAGAAPPGH